MFKWLFKGQKPRCRHSKKFGEPMPNNMVQIIRFSPYKTDTTGFGIRECTECGVRAFTCIGLHLMSKEQTDKIDAFINHKITLNELTTFFDKNAFWYKLEPRKQEH